MTETPTPLTLTLNTDTPPNFQLDKVAQRAVFDQILATAVPPVALGLTLLYALFAIGHLLVLEGTARTVMVPLAVFSVVYFAVLWWLTRRNRIALRWIHPVATTAPLLALLNSLVHMGLTQEIEQTSNLMLLIVASGLFLLLRPALLLVIVTAVASWLLVVWQLPPNPLTLHFSFGLPIAVLLAVVIQQVHRLTYLRMESLQLENNWRSERARLSTEKKYEQIFNNLALPVLELDWTPVLSKIETLKAQFPETWREALAAPSQGLQRLLNAVLVDANPAAIALFGFDDRTQMRREFPSTTVSETAAFPQPLLHALLTGETSFRDTLLIETRTGEQYTVEVLMNFLDEDSPSKALLTLRDITAEKEALAALSKREAQYQVFVAQSTEGIFRADLVPPMPLSLAEDEQIAYCIQNGVIGECNDAMARMYGFERAEELVNVTLPDRLPLLQENLDYLRNFVRSGYRVEGAVSQEHDREGNLHVIRKSLTGIIEDDRLLGVWGIQQDITEQVKAEEALRQTQRLESLGVMSSGIAHDFNNLLLAMLAQTTLAQAKLPDDHPAQPHLFRAADAAERGAQLTRQLLAFSGQAQAEPRPFDLNALIRANRHLLTVAIDKNVELVADFSPQPIVILGDEGQMQQIVMNLIINAAEAYDGRSGSVTITTRRTTLVESDPRRHTLSGDDLPPGDYSLLQVSDQGGGMAPETLSRIFDPFFTTKFTGRGLGLAAALGIVRAHGGGIQVESSANSGSTFSIFLPVAEVDWTPDTAVPIRMSLPYIGPTPPGTVLVIDDDAPIREAIAGVLALADISTLTAADGQQGLALYRRHREEIQLVILDLSMPNMTGQVTLAALREEDPDVRVLLSSGYSEDRVADELTTPGVIGFLPKPYKAESLLNIVRRYLGDVAADNDEPDERAA